MPGVSVGLMVLGRGRWYVLFLHGGKLRHWPAKWPIKPQDGSLWRPAMSHHCFMQTQVCGSHLAGR